MMYTLYYDVLPIYDPRSTEYQIRSTALHLGINESGNFTFTVEDSHPNFSNLHKLAGILELRNDSVPIYRGRIIRCSSDWNNSMKIESEGVMSCLNDSVIPPFSFPSDFESRPEYEEAYLHGNVAEYFFGWLLSQHNSQVSDAQKIKMGHVTVRDSNNYIYRVSESYASSRSILKSKLYASELGGYILPRYEPDGTYLDYYAELPESNSQQIEFGENLLDLTRDEDASGLFSAILPLGSDDIGIDSEVDRRLSDDLVKSGKIIYSESARAAYGNITSIQTWDDVTDAANLLAKAAEVMLNGAAAFSRTITVSACDLHLTDREICEFKVGRKTTIVSTPHNIMAVYPLSELDIDIQNPGSAVIKLSIDTSGESLTKSLGSIENSQVNQTDRLYTALEKYYTRDQTNHLLTDKVSVDDFASVLADVLEVSDVNVGGTLTVGGIPVDGYARFS